MSFLGAWVFSLAFRGGFCVKTLDMFFLLNYYRDYVLSFFGYI